MAEELKPKCVEDEIQYRLFPVVPEYISDFKTTQYLEEQLDTYLVHLSDLLVSYIWQNEPFNLSVIPGSGPSAGHLFGSTKFGDNIEDEWFIVYLLKSLTAQFDGLVVQVTDNDGEFLLIEAAEHLPKWLSPDTADNRIFLCKGKLHIVPRKWEISTVSEGVSAVCGNLSECQANVRVQRLIEKKLQGYPGKASESTHYTHCYIPAPLAAVLDDNPTLVAPMVHTFYYRDPIDLKACVTFQHFRPGTRIMRRVKMTRCLYAQLTQQNFQPDRRSGFTLPSPTHPQYRAHDLGNKLAHGAEMLCSKCDYSGSGPANHPRWKQYLAALAEKGYFRGELEGSQLYCKLLQEANTFFSTSAGLHDSKKFGPGDQVLHTLKTAQYDIEAMRKAEKHLQPPDDDSWLELTPESLDQMMQEAYGEAFQGTTTDLGKVAEDMSAFVNKVSSHEGVEFPKEEDQEVELDPNSFIHTMQKMFDFKDDMLGSSSDDMSEYGSDDDPDDLDDYEGEKSGATSSSQSVNSSRQGSNKGKGTGKSEGGKGAPELKISDYMEMMDRELAGTTIGESFIKDSDPERQAEKPQRPVPPPRRKNLNKNNATSSSDTPPTTKPKPPQRPPKPNTHSNQKKQAPRALSDDIDDFDDDFQPVNVDMNLVENLLESLSSQQGLAGPAGNILGRMGTHLPQDSGEGGTSHEVLD